MKKLVGFLLVFVMCFSLVACGNKTSDKIDADAKQKISEGLDKLKNLDEDYFIATTLQAPDGTVNYIEVVGVDGFSYTEYPLDADGNLGTLNLQSDGGNEYVLTDWLDTDGSLYLVNDDVESNTYKLPKTYANRVSSRKYGYLDVMLDRFTEISYKKDIEANLGLGVENLKLYKCKLPADTVKTIIGIGSYGLYDSIKTDYASDSNLVKLCNFYLEDLDMNLTFSDAIVTVGFVDDSIRYIGLEVGGLGTRLYMTKTFLPLGDNNMEIKAKPDFSGAIDYTTTLKDLAEFVSKFDNYEDAIDSINNGEFDLKEGLDGINVDDATQGDSNSSVVDDNKQIDEVVPQVTTDSTESSTATTEVSTESSTDTTESSTESSTDTTE